MSGFLEKIKSIQSKTEEVFHWLSDPSTSRLSPDDEFETDYLIDSLWKNINKLHSISKRYHLPGSAAATSSGSVNIEQKLDVNACRQGLSSSVTQIRGFSEETSEQNKKINNNVSDGLCLVDSDSDTTLPDEEEHQKMPDNENEIDDALTAFTKDNDDEFGCDFDADELEQIAVVERSYTDATPDDGEETDDCAEDEDYDPANQPEDKAYLDVLKKYFGYARFKPLQWKIISSVLNDRKDNCVIMSTGYGKSLCYQYPSVFTGRTTIVVSPLISLMEDQVMGLSAVNIKSCLLGSAQLNTRDIQAGILRGEYRVVYMTPEYISVGNDFLVNIKNKVGIDLIAIDEAHCVSQWGNDFRTSYRSLGSIRKTLPDVPIMALTATATPEVRKDICKSLKLRFPFVTCTGFDRPNLFLSVARKSGDVSRDLRSEMIRSGNSYEFEGSTIIYCPTKKSAEDVENVLKMMGCSCGLYHAGLPLPTRKKTHHKFINDELRVIVATVAFGMGIDKPDVRKIIHYGAPKDIESYYQEIGRAGRDGLPSLCHVFYGTADFNTNRFFLTTITNETFRQHKQSMLKKKKVPTATLR